MYNDYLEHHGIKGQKWGVRRFQYPDGSLTSLGRVHYGVADESHTKLQQRIAGRIVKTKTKKILKDYANSPTELGKKYVDTVLPVDTNLSRIQTETEFHDWAFYAVYKHDDVDKYMGLFGYNLKNRAKREGRDADVFQLRIRNVSRLKVPSEANASHACGKLLKDKTFADDLRTAISESSKDMHRSSQQKLFKDAVQRLNKKQLNDNDETVVYKALNLTLVNHSEAALRTQDRFYGELKKQGYDALLDLNDKTYSSYHAKTPVIVFNTSKVSLQAVTNANEKTMKALNIKYNARRAKDESYEHTIGTIKRNASEKAANVSDYVDRKIYDYLNKKK